MAEARKTLFVRQDGRALELFVTRDQEVIIPVLDSDRSPRDLTSDTPTVSAKAQADSSNVTYTLAVFGAATNGKLKLTMPAAQHTVARVGAIHIDPLLNGQPLEQYTIDLIDSTAD